MEIRLAGRKSARVQASRFAIGKAAPIKLFGVAKVWTIFIHYDWQILCLTHKIEPARLGLMSLKSGSLADM
jgi:hypothetical protein